MFLNDWPPASQPGPPKVAARVKPIRGPRPPKRTAPFDVDPGFYEDGEVWLFGNVRILKGQLALVPGALGPGERSAFALDEVGPKRSAWCSMARSL